MVALLRAVAIGINEYMDNRYRNKVRLQYARADADAVDSVLRMNPALQVEKLYLHRDAEATIKTVRHSMQEVFSRGGPEQNTIALLYFAGHGLHNPKDDRISLCCHDVDFSDPNVGGIRLNDIYELLLQCSAQCAIAIIDACFSGGIIDNSYFGHISPAEHAKRAIEALRGPEGKTIAIFAACRATQAAREDKVRMHGLYTHALLQGWHDGEARGSDGTVTLMGLADYITRYFAQDWQVPRVSILGSRPVTLWQGPPRPPAPPITPQQGPEPYEGITFKPGTSKVPQKKSSKLFGL